ncbi:MAG: hypothetical protein V7L05_04785 [Nostoc sp.]
MLASQQVDKLLSPQNQVFSQKSIDHLLINSSQCPMPNAQCPIYLVIRRI